MGMGRKRLRGAAALSIVALASALSATSASADELVVCVNECVVQPPPLGTAGRENAFLKIQSANGNAVDAFYKFRSGNSFHKDEFHKYDGLTNAFSKIESNAGQAFHKIENNPAFLKIATDNNQFLK
jgi:hypothetical protein